jgi:site-specific DNA-cytosine methylase
VRVLIACEFSGTVRDAFLRLGHDAMSCDLMESEVPGPHYTGDVRDVLNDGWDMMIAHPPCTHLAVSGARWFKDKQAEQAEALDFVRLLLHADIPRIALENPVSIISSRIRKPDQIIQPWQFGHGETKATCLWLKGLPLLRPSDVVEGREARVHRMPPGPDRWKERSRTFDGIAQAMAEQWGGAIPDMAYAGSSIEEAMRLVAQPDGFWDDVFGCGHE